MLLCLGLDYKRGGFVDRALEAFNEVLRLDPKNEYALSTCRSCTKNSISGPRRTTRGSGCRSWRDRRPRPQSQAILAFLENEIGLEAMRRKDYPEAARRFEAAIDLDARAVPGVPEPRRRARRAGQRARSGGDLGEADRGRARPRLPGVRSARSAGDPHRHAGPLHALCRRLIDETRRTGARGSRCHATSPRSGQPRDALDLLFAALVQNPHALGIHQAIWRALGAAATSAARSWIATASSREHAVFYLDPHVCMRCRYRSTELLWQCPHCHDWNTFVEERIAPAQDTAKSSC